MNEQPRRSAQRKKVVGAAKRLALREYLPLASWVLSWFMLGLAIGHADAVRLLAANAFAQSIRNLCTLEAMQVLARRAGADKATFRRARRTAFRIDLLSFLLCAVVTVAIATLLGLRGMTKPAAMVAIVAMSIPARNPLAILVAKRDRSVTWRVGSAATFAAGASVVLLLGLNWVAAAAVLALRDWGGLVATWLFAGKRTTDGQSWDEPLTFAEAARRTETGARQKLSYRVISSVASMTLGPFGNLAARTSREVGRLDSRLARLVPRSKTGFILFTLGTAGAAVFFLVVSREPVTLLASAAFARLAASGGAVLVWWRHGGESAEEEDMEEE